MIKEAFKRGFLKTAGQETNNKNEIMVKAPPAEKSVKAAKPGIQHSSGFTSGRV